MKTFHVIPNAHLDPVWLWDAAEGLNQAIRTMRSVLDLMDEFPFLTFTRGETALYVHLEEHDPDAFRRVLERIREGRWEVVGGTFLQSDTNLPRFETLAKNYEFGLEYCQSRLGVRPRTAWAADSFGHCAGLPDVLAGAKMENFAFTRPFPAILPTPKPAFWWRGPSGARVLCYRPEVGWYGTRRAEVPQRLDATLEKVSGADIDNVPVFLGIGDHGGGPSRGQIREVLVWAGAHPEVRVEWSGLQRFFDALCAEAAVKGGDAFFPELSGELGFTLRGCYTSCLRVKAAFRRAEAELATAETAVKLAGRATCDKRQAGHSTTGDRQPECRNVEMSQRMSVVECRSSFPFFGDDADFAPLWRTLLFNTFHDILPGSCIERAVEEQVQELGAVRAAARKNILAALNALACRADTSVPRPKGDFPAALPFLVFNPHPWNFSGPIELEGCIDDSSDYYAPYGGGQAPLVVLDPAKRRIPFQVTAAEAEFGNVSWRSRVIVNVRIPAQGFAVYALGWEAGQADTRQATSGTIDSRRPTTRVSKCRNAALHVACRVSSISSPRFTISARKGADGIRILRDGRPWLKGRGLQALLFRDPKGSWGDNEPRQYDESTPPVAWRVVHAEVIENGPLRSALFVRIAGECSWLELTLRLAARRDAIDCEARLLWNERAARLKLSLPCGAVAADYAVPGAVVRRAADVGEVPGGPWVRAIGSGGKVSLGFASDALYGFDIKHGALRPSVIRATGYAWRPEGGAPMDAWRPATDIGEHRFRFLLAPEDADMPRLAAELEQPPVVLLSPNSAPGPLGRSASLPIG